MNTPTPWRYGIGNECRNIYDANGALVCQVFHNYDDRIMIVEAVNKWAKEKSTKEGR